MGISTTVMKSVPSPGSPLQTPSSSISSFGSGLLWAVIFSRSFSMMSASTLVSSASAGVKSCASGTSMISCSSTGASVASSSAALASASAAAAAASASSCALDFLPRRLGAGASGAGSASSTGAATGISPKSEGCSTFLVRFDFESRFSPSAPFTV